MSWHDAVFEEIDMVFNRTKIKHIDERLKEIKKIVLDYKTDFSERRYLTEEAKNLERQRERLNK